MCWCLRGNIMQSKIAVTLKNDFAWNFLAGNLPKDHTVIRLDNLSLENSFTITATLPCDSSGRSLMSYFIICFM